MQHTNSYRPRVSRETRLLLTAGFAAIAVLWLLARVRFRDRPAPPSPIPAVLSQLTAGPKLDILATEIGDVQARLLPSLVAIDRLPGSSPGSVPRFVGLRYIDGLALGWLPDAVGRDTRAVQAVDRASGVGLLRVPGPSPSSGPVPWAPRGPQESRFLLATQVSSAGVSLRPTFVGAFEPVPTPLWSDAVWAVPTRSDLVPGSLLFTTEAQFVGLVIDHDEQRAIVPATTLLAEADRLLASTTAPAGTLGIEVQALTPGIAAATGASHGVVVTWVDEAGPANGRVRIGDVIEAIDGRVVASRRHWDVRMARLSSEDTVGLRGRSRGGVLEATLDAVSPAAQPVQAPTPSLGLTLRVRARRGSQVVALQSGSAGARAGLAGGDIITLIGDVSAPTPTQVARAFASMHEGQRTIVAVTRGATHFVTTLER